VWKLSEKNLVLEVMSEKYFSRLRKSKKLVHADHFTGSLTEESSKSASPSAGETSFICSEIDRRIVLLLSEQLGLGFELNGDYTSKLKAINQEDYSFGDLDFLEIDWGMFLQLPGNDDELKQAPEAKEPYRCLSITLAISLGIHPYIFNLGMRLLAKSRLNKLSMLSPDDLFAEKLQLEEFTKYGQTVDASAIVELNAKELSNCLILIVDRDANDKTKVNDYQGFTLIRPQDSTFCTPDETFSGVEIVLGKFKEHFTILKTDCKIAEIVQYGKRNGVKVAEHIARSDCGEPCSIIDTALKVVGLRSKHVAASDSRSSTVDLSVDAAATDVLNLPAGNQAVFCSGILSAIAVGEPFDTGGCEGDNDQRRKRRLVGAAAAAASDSHSSTVDLSVDAAATDVLNLPAGNQAVFFSGILSAIAVGEPFDTGGCEGDNDQRRKRRRVGAAAAAASDSHSSTVDLSVKESVPPIGTFSNLDDDAEFASSSPLTIVPKRRSGRNTAKNKTAVSSLKKAEKQTIQEFLHSNDLEIEDIEDDATYSLPSFHQPSVELSVNKRPIRQCRTPSSTNALADASSSPKSKLCKPVMEAEEAARTKPAEKHKNARGKKATSQNKKPEIKKTPKTPKTPRPATKATKSANEALFNREETDSIAKPTLSALNPSEFVFSVLDSVQSGVKQIVNSVHSELQHSLSVGNYGIRSAKDEPSPNTQLQHQTTFLYDLNGKLLDKLDDSNKAHVNSLNLRWEGEQNIKKAEIESKHKETVLGHVAQMNPENLQLLVSNPEAAKTLFFS